MDTIIDLVSNFVTINNQIISDYNKLIKRDKSIKNISSFIENIETVFNETIINIKQTMIDIRNQLDTLNDKLQGYDYVDPSGSGFNSYQLNDETKKYVQEQRELILKLEIYEIQLNLFNSKLMQLITIISSYTNPAIYNQMLYLIDKKESIQPRNIDGRIPYRKYEVSQAMILLSDYLPTTRDLYIASKIGLDTNKVGFIHETNDPHIADSLSAYKIDDGQILQVAIKDNYFTGGIWAIASSGAIDFDLFNMKPYIEFNMGENRLRHMFITFSKQIKKMVALRDETMRLSKIEKFNDNQTTIKNTINKIKHLLSSSF